MKQLNRTLESDRLYLRPLVSEDSDFYYSNMMNEEVRRLTGTQRIFTKQMIENYIEETQNESDRVHLLIVLKEEDLIIGEVALQDIDYVNRNSNIRVALFNEADFSKGFGTEALKLLLNYGFGVLNLHRIELNVYSYNARAIKAYEKLGFIQEGIQREVLYYNHQYHDSITMSILESEFRKTKE